MDAFNRAWIISNSKEVIETYSEGITLRQLYYRLVARGMTNDVQHYKRVVASMTEARWNGDVEMEAFVDRERQMYGETKAQERELGDEITNAQEQIQAWMSSYKLDTWSNQPKFVEVWIEKKALQGVFEGPCRAHAVALAPCKGYASLTFLNEAKERFESATGDGKEVVILYFGDYDPSGEDIPRSIKENLVRMGAEVEVVRVALNLELIKSLRLPGVPPKSTDSRTAKWDGARAVELDAVEPKMLERMCRDAIRNHFDEDLHAELLSREEKERQEFRKELKKFVNKKGSA